MRRVKRAVRSRGTVGAVLLLAATAVDGAAQPNADSGIRRPDRWFVTATTDVATREQTPRMLYLGRDGTVLIVQCAARDGRKTGGWAVSVHRDDWMFPADFLDGWWAVDSEPPVGPRDWGGSGTTVVLNDDELKERLLQPIEERIVFRVAQGTRQWELVFGPRDLATSIDEFAPSCEATE